MRLPSICSKQAQTYAPFQLPLSHRSLATTARYLHIATIKVCARIPAISDGDCFFAVLHTWGQSLMSDQRTGCATSRGPALAHPCDRLRPPPVLVVPAAESHFTSSSSCRQLTGSTPARSLERFSPIVFGHRRGEPARVSSALLRRVADQKTLWINGRRRRGRPVLYITSVLGRRSPSSATGVCRSRNLLYAPRFRRRSR